MAILKKKILLTFQDIKENEKFPFVIDQRGIKLKKSEFFQQKTNKNEMTYTENYIADIAASP